MTTEIETQCNAFTERCQSDPYFLRCSVARVLACDETRDVFMSLLPLPRPREDPRRGDSEARNRSYDRLGALHGPHLYSSVTSQGAVFKFYSGKSALDEIAAAANSLPSRGASPDNQLTLVRVECDWMKFLETAGKIAIAIPMGVLTVTILQTLLGTDVGIPLLVLLLAL
jgi:hypothetical protein